MNRTLIRVVTVCALSWSITDSAVAQKQRLAPLPDSLVPLRAVIATEQRFLAQWDSAWRATQEARRFYDVKPMPSSTLNSRGFDLHCHPELTAPNSAVAQGRLMLSRYSAFAVCPNWDPGLDSPAVEERNSIDEELDSKYLVPIRAARSALLTVLDSAAKARAEDNFLVGQRVRFLVDQRLDTAAVTVARACTGARWWCDALRGFVHTALGQVDAADSAFKSAFKTMPVDQRCIWNDFRPLIDFASREKYAALSCEQRDSVNVWLWWLAKPLYSEAGNAREVEQTARTVLLALRTTLARDERFDWNATIGGDTRRTMVMRYGWPSRIIWGGPVEDADHTGYLRGHTSRPNEPYTTYEYTKPRVHLVPVWHAIAEPFHARSGDWVVAEPPAPESQERTSPVQVVWWPIEHFASPVSLVQLPAGQVAHLRRQDSILMAVSVDLVPGDIGRRITESVLKARLVVSVQPESVRFVATGTGVVGAPLVLTGLIDARPAVAGVEYAASDARRPGGRNRFGITPPPPLVAMKPGEVAISEPVLLQAASSDEVLPSAPDSALKRMAGGTRVQNVGRLGVYWETYGVKATDSIEVAVWIERYKAQGFIRRFAKKLSLAEDLNTPVAITWQEAQAGHNAYVIDGPVPIIARSVTLDVTRLPKGDYWLDVLVRKPGQDPVRGRRSFTIN